MSVNQVNQTTGALSPIAGGTLYADAPVGSIQAYGGATAPWGWLLCQGQAISRTTYAELFGVIGTSFGAGDGSTTFNIPDLRGEFLRGAGTNSHSGQGSGGSVGQHQNATAVPDIYTAAAGTVIVSPGKDAIWSNTDAEVSASSGYKTVALSTAGGTNIPSNYMVRPTNTSVNFIIKATTIALPSDFETAVDEKIAANIVDSITDGNIKAVTSNAVYDMFNNPTISEYQDIQLPSNWWTDSSKAVALRIVRFGIIKAIYRNSSGIKMPYTDNRSLEGLFPAGTVRESLRPAMGVGFYIRNLNNETNSTYQSLQTVLLTISADGAINGYCYNGVGVQSSINDANNPLWIYI